MRPDDNVERKLYQRVGGACIVTGAALAVSASLFAFGWSQDHSVVVVGDAWPNNLMRVAVRLIAYGAMSWLGVNLIRIGSLVLELPLVRRREWPD